MPRSRGRSSHKRASCSCLMPGYRGLVGHRVDSSAFEAQKKNGLSVPLRVDGDRARRAARSDEHLQEGVEGQRLRQHPQLQPVPRAVVGLFPAAGSLRRLWTATSAGAWTGTASASRTSAGPSA